MKSETSRRGGSRKPARRAKPKRARRFHPLRASYLFAHWKEVAAKIRQADRVALFCDFDGTLVPFRQRPDRVVLRASVRRALSRLAHHPRARVWIVSGRRAADLRRRVGVRNVRYFGLHGWERDGRTPAGAEVLRARLARARKQVGAQLVKLAGIWVENKEFSFVIHFRGASAATLRRATHLIWPALRPFRRRLRVLKGKKMWEVLPQEIKGKGFAVRSLLGSMSPRPLAIYVGDDTTDESVFGVLRRGITVRVGQASSTRAQFHVRNPEQVRSFLVRAERELR